MSDEKQNIEAIFPLTPLQEGILFHVLESAKPGVYFQQLSCTFPATLNPDRLFRSWQVITTRHAALRTLITWERRDRPLQVVRKQVEVPWRFEDWHDRPADTVSASWQELLTSDRAQGFKLDQAPLVRVTLVRVSDQEYRMLWSVHHIVMDGWSARLLLDELVKQYRGETLPDMQGVPSFADFVKWLDRQDLVAADVYWRQTLAGFNEPSTPFFLERSPTSQPGKDTHGVHSTRLCHADTRRAVDYARRQRLTLNTLLVGAWAIVLSRAADAAEVVFGTTVAGRPSELPEVDRTVGLFINTLPLRIKLDQDQSPQDWLRTIQRDQLSARNFAHTSLTQINRCSELPPGSRLFDTIVVVENLPDSDSASAADQLHAYNLEYREYSNYPFALLAVPGETLELIAVFDPTLVQEAHAQQLLNGVSRVMAELVATPASLSKIGMLHEPEQTHILELSCGEELDGRFEPAHVSFELAVARSPDAIAIRTETSNLSYRELNAAANSLARRLVDAGTKKGSPVALYLERSIEAIVGILAVLKAGGAYVPLDPHYPNDRVSEILDDLDCGFRSPIRPLVLTRRSFADQLPQTNIVTLMMEDFRSEDAKTNLDVPVAADQLAYIIYTSGSTGKPKGVMISQANLAASTRARTHFYSSPPHRYLLMSSLATDSSVAGIFWTLTSGTTLLLPRYRAEQDMATLLEWMTKEHVTHTLYVPSLHRLLLEHMPQEQETLTDLRTVIVAAERSDHDLVAAHHKKLPNAALANEYGPTEGTVWATAAWLDPNRDPSTPIPIGRPIHGARAYVLDRTGNLLPAGWPGELYIGGSGIAQGYLGRPDETRQRFTKFRFDDTGLLYRTGDVARWLPDGQLTLLGRLDNQIKVRGYRVEPEEIESFLLLHPHIQEAVVVQHRGDVEVEPTTRSLADRLANHPDAERLIFEIEKLSQTEILKALNEVNET